MVFKLIVELSKSKINYIFQKTLRLFLVIFSFDVIASSTLNIDFKESTVSSFSILKDSFGNGRLTGNELGKIPKANIDLIKKYPPNVIFVYSLRSAESFNSIVANYSLAPMMTQSIVMCISKKIVDFFNKAGWKNNKIFNPGNEIIELEKIK